MEHIRQWIIGITCVAAILALSDALMPTGGVKKAGKLAGGLLLMLTVVQPILSLDMDVMAEMLTRYRVEVSDYSQALELEHEQLTKMLIEEQTHAYILDKMEALGMDGMVRITFAYGENGAAWPVATVAEGVFTDAQQEELSRWLESELAIPIENQTYIKAET